VERPISEPGAGQVRIRVEACGICHTDAATVTGTYPGLTLPRVPGHEVVGRIEALGSGVSRWKIGQRVGVGLIAGEDGVCEPCRRGDIVNCQNPVISGVTVDGGYAEMMIAEARGLASIPDELSSAEAAPLLCAGITTYNALRNAGLRGGDLVAVQGIGGLGHLGIQFARHMGFHTVAIGRGRDKEKLAKDLGAHVYIDTQATMRQRYCSVWAEPERFSLPAPVAMLWGPLVSGLAARGKLIVVGCRRTRSIECISARLRRSLDLRLTDRHGDRSGGHSCLQRAGGYPPDDRDGSSRTGCRCLRSHDARQSTVPHGAGYKETEPPRLR
jgi:propanol-preferring alcohol dehydrogenase